jgi:hypothetical protein
VIGMSNTTIALAWITAVAAPAEPHITPTVELVPLDHAVRQLLPGATQFFLRDVRMSKEQVTHVESLVSWVPEEKEVKFYIGRESGRDLGSVEWIKVDSRHGPVGIAVRFTPDGQLDGAIVTHATEETVNWVKEVIDAGLLDQFPGKTLTTIDGALRSVKSRVGRMPAYMGEVIVRGVARATALRQAAYAG